LTGSIKKHEDLPEGDSRRYSPRFQVENLNKNLRIVEMLEQLAKEKQCTPPQLALGWCLAQGEFIVPIPGTKKIKYLYENVEAVNVQFTAKEIERINIMFPLGVAMGERYPAVQMQRVWR
jgi:aryl-alcohol dehydrogenase-like predicted oxidoreductase